MGDGAQRSLPEGRRHQARVPVQLLVRWRTPGQEELATGYAVNLSPSGLFVRCERPPPVGAPLFVHLCPKDASALLVLRARVSWVNPPGGSVPGMGLELLGLDEGARAALEAMCASGGRRA